MLSYTGSRNLFGNLANLSDSTTLALADTLINQKRREVLAKRKWWFFEKAFTLTTTASTQFYALPGQIDRILSSPYVTVGSTRYTPRECPSRQYWDQLNLVSYTADIPEWWIQYGNQIGFFPTPASSSNTVTINAKQKVIDLTVADYTTGTIVSVANGGTAVVGSGTSWTAGMVGKYMKITSGNAANLGDDTWYPVSAVGSTTAITLGQAYGGVAISAGSASYTIGQMGIIPQDYDAIPVYQALQLYFTSIDPEPTKAQLYGGMAENLLKQMESDHSNRTGGMVLDEGIQAQTIVNPNLTIGF